MMPPAERELALHRMHETVNRFYTAAIQSATIPSSNSLVS